MIATGKGRSPRRKGREQEADTTSTQSAASRYEVIERAGEGTLFVVYRVRDRQTNGYRALKALKGPYSRHEKFAPAVLKLVEQTSRLNHPHVAAPLEAGREEGTIFLVEDWLPGGALEGHLRRTPLDIEETRQVGVQLAQALEYLHAKKQVHGDLRPRQVLFDEEDVLRLGDIGFSQAFEAAEMALSDVQLDAVAYTAPERFDGELPSVATDLYSLGVVLYRAVTGRVPFDGPSPLSIAMRHRNDKPLRPTQWNKECPEDLEKAILRLLAKDPEDRYASAAQLLDDIAPDRDKADLEKSKRAAVRPLPVDKAAQNGNSLAEPPARGRNKAVQPSPRNRPAVEETEDEEDFLSEEERERRVRLGKKKHRRREMLGAVLALFWLLVFIGLLAGMLQGALVFWMNEAPPEIAVPRYAGLSQADAEAVLAHAGLKMAVAKEVFNPKKPEGTIMGGEPPAGKVVRKGRTILVTVSRGEAPIPMYDFTEITLERARAIIMKHGLRLGQISEQYHSTVPKGYICGQYPETGESFRRSEPISLIISRGPQPSAVAPSPDQLPDVPEASPTTPGVRADDPSVQSPASPQEDSSSEAELVARSAKVSVALPANGGPQEIKILVRDATGDYVAYQQTHEPGDVVEKVVDVVRSQSGTALVRVYVGDKLLREIRV